MPASPSYLHDEFAARLQNFSKDMQRLKEEAARLNLIYVNYADEGRHEDFVDVEFASAAQLSETLDLCRELTLFFENGNIGPGWRTQKLLLQ